MLELGLQFLLPGGLGAKAQRDFGLRWLHDLHFASSFFQDYFAS